MWLIVALVGYAVNSAVSVMDKFVLEKAVNKPAVFLFLTMTPASLIIFLVPWSGFLKNWLDASIAVFAGLAMLSGLWASYIAVKKSEISHVGPLIGAVVPVCTFFWGRLFLGENYSLVQMAAILLLVCGSLVISMEKSQAHSGFHSGLAWGILGGFLWSIFAVCSKYLYAGNGFFSGFVWVQGMAGVIALLLFFMPSVRAGLKRSKNPEESMSGKKLAIVITDKTLGVVGLVLVQYAVALGSVTLVYALAGIQYALLVMIVAIMSKFNSKFYRETYTRGELLQEISAIILIAAGFALIV